MIQQFNFNNQATPLNVFDYTLLRIDMLCSTQKNVLFVNFSSFVLPSSVHRSLSVHTNKTSFSQLFENFSTTHICLLTVTSLSISCSFKELLYRFDLYKQDER